MTFTLERDSPALPGEVLEAIRSDAREWRESVLPPKLREGGVYGIAARIQGHAFTLYYEGGSEGWPDVSIRGMVTPLPEGGSRVSASVNLRRAAFAGPLVFAGMGVVVWISGGSGAVAAFVIAAALVGVNLVRKQGLSRQGSPEARYLAERLEAAIAAARHAPARHSEPAV